MIRKRALVIHGSLLNYGGAEHFCIRLICALQESGYKVTLLHGGGDISRQSIVGFSGTSFDVDSLTVLTPRLFKIFPLLKTKLKLLQYAINVRSGRKLVRNFDLVVSSYGECPIKFDRLIQIVHFPLFFYDKGALHALGASVNGLFDRIIRVGYVVLGRKVAGWNPALITQSLILVNSNWTGSWVKALYKSSQPKTLYMGVLPPTNKRLARDMEPWQRRRNNFVVLGRVLANKRTHLAIDIIEGLRVLGHDVGLIIIGNGSGPYAEEVKNRIENKAYISWMKNLSKADVEDLISMQKWGLHCMATEHYGLAAIEMLQLGCIVFVPDDGGQTEVIADEAFRYVNSADGIAKIHEVIISPDMQNAYLLKARNWIDTHSDKEFKRRISEYFSSTVS